MRKCAKLLVLIIAELIILGIIVIPSVINRKEPVILSPEMTEWQSRYISYDGAWHATDTLFEEQEIGEESIDIIYGPYMSLPAGCYNVSIAYESDSVQTFEAYSAKDPKGVFIHEPEVLIPGLSSKTYHFTLLRSIDDLEIRVHYDGNGSITVSNINVTGSSFLVREVAIALFLFFVLLNVCLMAGSFSVSPTGRETWIDICRGFGIILVLLGHADPPFKWLIYGFHMPLFFMLSGYLYKEGVETKSYISKLFRSYVIPYFILCAVNLVITLVQNATGEGISSEWVKRYVNSIIYTGEYLPNCLPLWFLTSLFVTMILLHFIHKADSKWIRLFVVAAFATVSLVMYRLDCPTLPWGIDLAVMGVVFAEIGNTVKRYSLIERFSSCSVIDKGGVLIVLLVCGVDSIFYNHELSGEIANMGRYYHFPLWLVGAVCVNLAIMLGVSLIASSDRFHLFAPLEALGRHTITFFAFDFCMAGYAAKTMSALLNYTPWYFIMPVKLVLLIALFAILYFIINPLTKKRIWFL